MPSSQNVVFELERDQGGVLEVTWHRPDAFMADNQVLAPIDPPRPLRIMAVTDRDEVRSFLHKYMDDLSPEAFELKTSAEYEAAPDAKITVDGRSAFDLVIIDNHDTSKLPPGNYLLFNSLPKLGETYSRGDELVGKPLVFGREGHPLLHSVNYDSLYIARWRKLKLPPNTLPLLEGEDSTVMALVADAGHRYVITSFDLLDSDFPIKPAFPIFMQNTITFLAGGGLVDAGRLITPGDTETLNVPPGAEKLRVTRPDGSTEDVDVRNRATASYARTQDTGLYKAVFDDRQKTTEMFAVNILDPVESCIAPNESFAIGEEKVSAISAARRINESLWPYAAAAALALVLLEWWVYNKRVMI